MRGARSVRASPRPARRGTRAAGDNGRGVGGGVGARRVGAAVTIAADGRRSTIAFGLGLARHPVRPRRWAIGAYFGDGPGTDPGPSRVRPGSVPTFGEM